MKAIINGKIILPDEIVENKILLFSKKIIGFYENIPKEYKDVEIIDAKGKYVSPGLIDIHIHGNVGYDFMNTSLFENSNIEKSIASNGVTGYLMTTMTMSQEKIHSALKSARVNIKNKNKEIIGAKPLGVHLEGPFLNEVYKGAQDSNFIISPSCDFIEDYKDIIKVITYAPEKDVNLEFAKYISNNTDIVLSMGHTNATYDEALNAFNAGVKHATHLFNAMTGLNHRDPGVVGACLLNDGFKCELIADTIHIHKDLFNLIVKSKKLEDIILVTDAMEAANMSDGLYSIGGHPVAVENNSARLVSNGALAGSVLSLNNAIRNFYENTSLDLNEVIKLASLNPAKSLNIDNIKGSLEIGKDADIVIFDKNIECYKTFVEGKLVYEKSLRIKDIKEKLLSLPDMIVKTSGNQTLCNEYGSYRGRYSDLYVGLNLENESPITSHELVNLLDKAISSKVMYGYRGGESSITENTVVAISNYGEAKGFYIKDIYQKGECIIIEHN